ncbi:MAG: Ig-like domain-containing protein, partial [Betaproteobacteria bacterium]
GLNTSASVALTVNNTSSTVSTPPPTSGSLNVWFKAPRNGNTVSGVLSGTSCYVAGSGITRVAFKVDSTALNADTTMSDGMQCVLDTTKLSNGTHTLTATATGSNGATRSDVISINVQNSGTTTPTPTNAAPAVSFTSPAAGTVSGTVNYAVNATDDKAVTRVVFKVGGTTIADKTAAPWSGSLNTTTLTNAAHSLTATAYDAEGLNTTATVSLNVSNTTTTPPPSAGGMPTDSTGVAGVATFESIGLYWANPGASSATGCKVQFRKQGESAWRDGLGMWFDSRNSECRGSLVHLTPGTSYEVQMGLPGQSFRKGLTVATWSEQYSIARTVTLTPGAGQVNITQGGTKDGYVLYTAAPGTVLDVNNSADYNVLISAPYVIVRGLTLRGARIDAIRLAPGAGDVVIEGNDISNWGRSRSGSLGVDYDSGVRAYCTSSWRLERVVVQRNRIHDPRYGSNDWSSGHPIGPQAVTFSHCGGNHVFRHNEIYSSVGKYFNDAIGGEDNFSDRGFPYADTDIYGNKISGTYDDAIEVEGANRNVRIWGNYTDGTYTSVASTATHIGPFYVFRNVTNSVTTFAKSGQAGGYGGGRRYFFHNTTLGQAAEGIKGNSNQPMTNSWTRNNVLQLRSSGGIAVGVISGTENNLDYDLANGSMTPYSGAEANGISGTPTYVSGHGPANPAGGNYQLAPGSRGSGQAVRIPNFNDVHAAPDMGAHQAGTPAMKFGIQ